MIVQEESKGKGTLNGQPQHHINQQIIKVKLDNEQWEMYDIYTKKYIKKTLKWDIDKESLLKLKTKFRDDKDYRV